MLPNKNEGRVKIWAGSSSEGNSGNRRGSTRFHSTDRKISEELVNRLVSDLKETSLVWKTSSRYRRNKRASGRLWLQILNHLWVILTHKLHHILWFLLVHFHQKHLKVGLKFKKFEICEERIAELFSFLAEMQQFVHQSSTQSEEKQTETLCLIPSKQFVWAAAWISSE